MSPSAATRVVLFSCLALAALTVRPIWEGARMVRAPAAIRAERFDGFLTDEWPPGEAELKRAQRIMIQAVGPGYTDAQLEAAVRSNRMIDRVAHENWQQRQAKRIAAAERGRLRGFAVIGTCVAVIALWAVGGTIIIRRAGRES
jgi:hypothetical protein